MLVDRAQIMVRSGKGGNGASHMRQEKSNPKAGPDGGDGGDGGDVTLVTDPHLDTLLAFRYQRHFFAKDGEKGQSKSCHGANGESVEVRVPCGTLVFDEATEELLCDMVEPGLRLVVAKGGKGGLGNERFKTSTHQSPTEFTPGEPAIERTLRFELKLIADVGLVGLPNAGKSTMLSALTRAEAKVGAYPFTTLSPQLGIAELPGDRRLVFADLPGLIAGAAEGAGLGHDFLRHIERTRVILHLVDVVPDDGSDPVDNVEMIRNELAVFSPELGAKPELLVLNKIDLIPEAERAKKIMKICNALRVPAARRMVVSGATGEGLRDMLEACWKLAAQDVSVPWRAV
ncbi:MAG: GTPase ObgE [Planctomycetes bacterium]|nr:GTPase ObgE [Planctomycetota bacterium]